jgi:hypothetical protein
MPTIRKCAQVGVNGAICKSPALRENKLCYYHNRDQQRRVVFQQARQMKLSKDFADYPAQQELLNPEILEALDLPALDDAASIQVALTSVYRALLSGHIDTKRGGLVLYALQIAAANIQNAVLRPLTNDQVAAEDAQPIAPLYPPNCAYFPVPNSPKGEKPPQRDANSTLGNLPRNDFKSIFPDPNHPIAQAEALAKANPAKNNGEPPEYFPYSGAKTNGKHAP